MNVLGINAFHADSAAALVVDGKLVAAVAEERLNRIKHFAGFPELAIRECLRIGGCTIKDIDYIAIGRDGRANLMKKLGFSLSNLSRIPKLAQQRLVNRAKLANIGQMIADAFELPPEALRPKMRHVEHHLSHLASAFLISPFDRAALLSIDGFGDFASTMTGLGQGGEMSVLDRTVFPHSAGILYTMISQFIGFRQYGDEGKVMGLAPYGSPVYADFFEQLVRLKSHGAFELNLDYFIHHSEGVDYSFDQTGLPTVAPLFSLGMVKKFGAARVKGAELTERDLNLAASLQQCLEKIYFHVLRHLHDQTGCNNLCLAGGVALNAVANGKIFGETPFRQVFTHPAATDDGTAVGAAFFVYHQESGRPREFVLESASTGPQFSDAAIERCMELIPPDRNVVAGYLPDEFLFPYVAEEIAAGKVVGWFQGCSEWGPRALGNRSIIAHPGHPKMKNILNARIKHREWFRPFAPSVLAEQTGKFFELDHPSPFMTMVYKIKPEKRAALCAVNHFDDTGRLQTVTREQNPRYYQLIQAFEAASGLPVVLNTSFNENEPIVNSPDEARDCFLRTRMDLLVMGNRVATKVDSLNAPNIETDPRVLALKGRIGACQNVARS